MRSKQLTDLAVKLSKYGNVEAIKESSVFTLMITAGRDDLTQMRVYTGIMGLITEYTKETYPVVEVLKNDSTFFLAVFAPAASNAIYENKN